MKETYTRQMLGLNHQIKYNGGDVPNITFGVYSQACILIFTPFLWWLYHILEKFGVRVTPLRRIGEYGNSISKAVQKSLQKEVLHHLSKINMICALSQNYQHFF